MLAGGSASKQSANLLKMREADVASGGGDHKLMVREKNNALGKLNPSSEDDSNSSWLPLLFEPLSFLKYITGVSLPRHVPNNGSDTMSCAGNMCDMSEIKYAGCVAQF